MNHTNKLTALLTDAAEKAFTALFSEHPEHFYYCTLVSIDGYSPCISAISEEALDRILAENDCTDDEDARLDFKWSYADSPYCAYGEEYFAEVNSFMDEWNIFDLDDDDFEEAFETLLFSMEEAMRNLDEKGIFGTGTERKQVFINAEVMPPDYTNTKRAERLNPPEAMADWLKEAAETEE